MVFELSGFSEFVRMEKNRSHIKLGGFLKEEHIPLKVDINIRHTTIRNPLITDLFQIGGINTLRGYWPGEIFFKTGLWFNTELRFVEVIYPFFDFAHLDQKQYYGAGIGSDLMGENLGLRLAIGLPLPHVDQAKLHAILLGRL